MLAWHKYLHANFHRTTRSRRDIPLPFTDTHVRFTRHANLIIFHHTSAVQRNGHCLLGCHKTYVAHHFIPCRLDGRDGHRILQPQRIQLTLFMCVPIKKRTMVRLGCALKKLQSAALPTDSMIELVLRTLGRRLIA